MTHVPLTREERANLVNTLHHWSDEQANPDVAKAVAAHQNLLATLDLVRILFADLEAMEAAVRQVPEWCADPASEATDDSGVCLSCKHWQPYGHAPGCAWVRAKEMAT